MNYEKLVGLGSFAQYRDYRDRELPNNGSISYGSCDTSTHHIDDDSLFLPSLFMHSDYSGSTVERSNCAVFMERYGALDGVYEVSGGYGTTGVAVRLRDVTDDMLADFQALTDYPLMDEDHLSQLEMELEDEDWNSWISRDFQRALLQKFPEHEDAIDAIDDDALYALYRERCEVTNEYWRAEDAVSGYIDIERLLHNMTEEDLR